MREFRPYGSVRGARSDARPYRDHVEPVPRQRAAWTSTFIASLEPAKQGDVALAQEDRFTAIHVSPA
jgi:chromatin segregation and condensation protein Rec8/ScpA/Scc1 (kleisin family)